MWCSPVEPPYYVVPEDQRTMPQGRAAGIYPTVTMRFGSIINVRQRRPNDIRQGAMIDRYNRG